MNIRDHGSWVRYTPAELPSNAPSGALFAKRESDGQDWYLYVHPGTNFEETSVKFTAMWQEPLGGYIVGPAVYDATMLFPAGQIIGEITDYTGVDPQADFGNKLYDPAAGTFSVPVEPEPVASPFELKVLSALASIVERLEKLEKKET